MSSIPLITAAISLFLVPPIFSCLQVGHFLFVFSLYLIQGAQYPYLHDSHPFTSFPYKLSKQIGQSVLTLKN